MPITRSPTSGIQSWRGGYNHYGQVHWAMSAFCPPRHQERYSTAHTRSWCLGRLPFARAALSLTAVPWANLAE